MALSISPSQQWEGNDGPWSTFNVNIGNPYQQMRVLPATSESVIIVVYNASACNSSCPENWADRRGGTFQPAQPGDLTWVPQKPSGPDQFYYLPFETEAAIGTYSFVAAEVGLDTLRLDWNGTNAPANGSGVLNQVVGVYDAQFPWLGLLGISGRPSYLNQANTAQNSSLLTLFSEGNVTSNFWAYTAGAQYKQVDGSLTFGGYDADRGTIDASKGALISSMNTQDSDQDLQVIIISIAVSGSPTGASGPVGDLPVKATLDSTVPEIWLPNDVADTIATVLGLTWNDTYSAYLISEDQDTQLSGLSPTIQFSLTNTTSSKATTITLPYDAFSRTAMYPLYGVTANGTSQKYLGIKRTGNDSSHSTCYLGRTFFQEAYVTADYELNQFTVSAARHVGTMNIVAVGASGGSVTSSSKTGGGLSGGAIAGIAVGAVAAICIIAGLVWFFRRRQRSRSPKQRRSFKLDALGSTTDGARTTSMDNTTAVDEHEMTGPERVEEYFAKTHRPSGSNADESGFLRMELDANTTARGNPNTRHELPDTSPRPTPPRSGPSWGSGISPVGPDGRHVSMGFGEPSPPLGTGPLSGHGRHRTTSDGSVPGVSPGSMHTRHFSDGSVPSVEEGPRQRERTRSDGSFGVVHELHELG